MGLGATMAGGALAARSPSATHALHVVAPFIRGGRSSIVRHLDRGADIFEHKQEQTERAAEKARKQAEKEQAKQAKEQSKTQTDGQQPSTPATVTLPEAPTSTSTLPADSVGTSPIPQPSQAAPPTTQFSAAPNTGGDAPPRPGLSVTDLPTSSTPAVPPPNSGTEPASGRSGPGDPPTAAPPVPKTGSAAALPEWKKPSAGGNDTSPRQVGRRGKTPATSRPLTVRTPARPVGSQAAERAEAPIHRGGAAAATPTGASPVPR